jgi:hypothetical protein
MGHGVHNQSSIASRRKRFLPTPLSRLALGPNQPPTQWVLEAHSPGVKWPPPSAEVKNGGTVPPLLHMSS